MLRQDCRRQRQINYCVRWKSTKTATATNRADIETAIKRSFKKRVGVLAGFDWLPCSTVDVKVVGRAVNEPPRFAGSTDDIDVYTIKDSSGAPECDPKCARSFNQDSDYSECTSGADRHYGPAMPFCLFSPHHQQHLPDQSLWLSNSFEGGAGDDWGQRVGLDYFLTNFKEDRLHINLHELGNTFGLGDFYDWTPTGMKSLVMLAGDSMTITRFDAWMARDQWTKAIKSRYPGVRSRVATLTSVAAKSAAFSTSLSASTATGVPTASPASQIVSASPTGYSPIPAPGNSTIQPTGFFPTGIGVVPLPTATGSVVFPTRSAVTSTRMRRRRWSKSRTQPTPVVKLELFNWAKV